MKSKKRLLPPRSDAGFGLTEMAVAIVVLGIILVGLFPLVINSIGLADQNTSTANANRIVVRELESMKTSFVNVPCSPTVTPQPLALSSQEQALYTGQRTIACPATPGLATITVEIFSNAPGASGGPVASATTQVKTLIP